MPARFAGFSASPLGAVNRCSRVAYWVLLAFTACHPVSAPPEASLIEDMATGDALPFGSERETPDAAKTADGGEAGPEGMLFVPAGTFTMGAESGGEEDERPAHPVTLEGFWLDRTPVTNDAYRVCVAEKVCREGDRTIASRRDAGSDADFLAARHPIVGVSWDDAKTFCSWAGKRLPREAEYERAMRGDDHRKYAWGDDPPSATTATFGRVIGWVGATTDEVGTHPAGRGPYGHDDLAGNVWEWCDDYYDPYAYRRTAPATCAEIMATQDDLRARNLQGFTGSNPIPHECERVLRGGGFNYEAAGLRVTNRVHHPARYRMLMAGFRCAK